MGQTHARAPVCELGASLLRWGLEGSEMTFEEFTDSIANSRPPTKAPPLLRALWYERRGDWEKAHQIAQDVGSAEGSLVHAYLHRREGDQGNAAYWYRRAGRPVNHAPLEREWEEIVRQLLD